MVGVYTSMVRIFALDLLRYPLTLGAQLALDLIAIGLLLANAVDQPYREHGEIISRLQRDGILFFMVCVVVLKTHAAN